MTCDEARQYIFAFLDNELDSALSLAVQQHIEHCPLCARECEIENQVRRQLSQTLQRTMTVPPFEESALTQMLRHEWYEKSKLTHVSQGPRRYWRTGVAGVVAAGLLVTAALLIAPGDSEPVPLADALVNDFQHFVAKAEPLQLVSGDAEEVSDWLRERTALAVTVPAVDPALGSLMGGRKCRINGAPAAFAVYRIGADLASVVVLRETGDALTRMKRIDGNGHTHWVDHCRGHTVLACRRGAFIYAVVSRLAADALSPLMPPVQG